MEISGRARTIAVVGLACYLVLLLTVLLSPSAGMPSAVVGGMTDVLERLRAPDVVLVPGRVEFVANVAIIVPATALGGLLWRGPTWRDWTAYGFVFAGGVELVQGLLLSARSATYVDVVANTLGALGGAVLAALLTAAIGSRSQHSD